MTQSSDLRLTKMPLNNGSGQMPALGFGTLIPEPAVTIAATRDAVAAGFRHFDCAERYRNEREVGEGLQAELASGRVAREDIFVTTKLWNTNHRPERVEPAFEASLEKLGLDYLDLYLIHTPFAFQPGDEQDPRDQDGHVQVAHVSCRGQVRHGATAGVCRVVPHAGTRASARGCAGAARGVGRVAAARIASSA